MADEKIKEETTQEKSEEVKAEVTAAPQAKAAAPAQKPATASTKLEEPVAGEYLTAKSHNAKAEEGDEKETIEKVVFINRCAKVVKGGRRFSFSALVVLGDGQGSVGVGFGKANEVAECIRKANEDARKNQIKVNLEKTTIPHEVLGEFGGSRVLLKPASPGTGVIAGGGVRAVVEAAGIKDLLGKSLGSDNPSNVVKAALNGLEQLTHREEVLRARGK